MLASLDWSVLWQPPYGEQIVGALLMTLQIAAISWVLAMAIGILVGLTREAPLAAARYVAGAHVELFRNIPVLVQLFFIYYVLPRLLPPDLRRALFHMGWESISAVLALSLYSSAKIAEHVRAGLNSVSQQLRQAALASGLTWWQAQRYVVLPLLLRVIAPSLTSEFVTIFKGSSLAMTVGVVETAYVTQEIGVDTFHWIEANSFGTLVYLTCAWLIAALMSLVERLTFVPGLMRRGAG
ncbi:MAG TPA: amino acid ABC transporter permease [Rhizomicrobium sp.]|nr:amino acid ABC transporter permease [Rhizomicrobium sp.]